ncbi:PREDICTED: glycosyl-phosphatidylinositol-anchored molecule-like protein [Chrysochloris asiatica]|uniref:Glycosyl-phosphatidylinositol-anchored molecule-like protein n=1 Tax=Chrysochloris asiatica TaxID=185453 RepID=A0A9B0SUG4_CHRAS|nr:PREDICTED: glycosyl-phosphatidylinositol-anchored molecule-like protein [Chrysochloris asiatica]
MCLLVLLMASGLPLAVTNFTLPVAEANLTWPLAESSINKSLLMETSFTRPPMDTGLIQSLANINVPDSQRKWTYNVVCHSCAVLNTFTCNTFQTCDYNTRRCMIVAIRLNLRNLLVYKGCAFNCTFTYASQQPPEAPRKITRKNNFYYVHCCGVNRCNFGGPTNVERDMLPFQPIEENLPEGTVPLGESTLFLSLVSIIINNALT